MSPERNVLLEVDRQMQELEDNDGPVASKPQSWLTRPSMCILAASTAATWAIGLIRPNQWSLVLVGAFWIVFGAYVFYRLAQNGHGWLAIIPGIPIAIISVFIVLPSDVFNWIMEPLNSQLSASQSPLPAGKLGHVAGFFILTAILYSIRHSLQLKPLQLLSILLLLAAATEGMQLYIPQRTPTLRDFLFDSAGIASGALIVAISRWLFPTMASRKVRAKE